MDLELRSNKGRGGSASSRSFVCVCSDERRERTLYALMGDMRRREVYPRTK